MSIRDLATALKTAWKIATRLWLAKHGVTFSNKWSLTPHEQDCLYRLAVATPGMRWLAVELLILRNSAPPDATNAPV